MKWIEDISNMYKLPDNFIKWDGYPEDSESFNPLDSPACKVEVVLRNGVQYEGTASDFDWDFIDNDQDIIAYRIL